MLDDFSKHIEKFWSVDYGTPTEIKVINYFSMEIDEERYRNFRKFAIVPDSRGAITFDAVYKNLKYEYSTIGNWIRCGLKDKTYMDIYAYIQRQFDNKKIDEKVYKALKELNKRFINETSNKQKSSDGFLISASKNDYKYMDKAIYIDNIEQSENIIQSNKENFGWKEFNVLGLKEEDYKKKCKKSKAQIKEELKEIEENNQSKKEDSEVKYTKVYKKREERKIRETKAKEIKRRKAIENMDDGSLDLPF